jgi:biotin operon repressor
MTRSDTMRVQTRREQVAALHARGLTFAVIADQLGLSFATVGSDVQTLRLAGRVVGRKERRTHYVKSDAATARARQQYADRSLEADKGIARAKRVVEIKTPDGSLRVVRFCADAAEAQALDRRALTGCREGFVMSDAVYFTAGHWGGGGVRWDLWRTLEAA